MQRIVFGGVTAATLLSGVAWAIGSNTTTNLSTLPSSSVTVVTGGTSTSSSAVRVDSNWSTALAVVPPTTVPLSNGFEFGVQTHFSQGWDPALLDLTTQIGTHNIRDTVSWASAERTRGKFDFSGAAVATLKRFCAGGGRLTLTIVPKNPLYDAGLSVYSASGQTAYADYLAALTGQFGSCLSAVEIGNEVNGDGTLDYPAGYDRATTYVSTLRTLYTRIKAVAPAVTVLGGSTNAIGTGFLDTLFAAGMLNFIDGVAVHPYRNTPEGIDLEIAHLTDVMARYGAPKPIWATEYSFGIADQRDQAAALVKSVVQLYSAGVTHANWYALIEQKAFPNMGLFVGQNAKYSAGAFRMAETRLLPYGKPVRIDTRGRPINLFWIGTDRWVAWGDDTVINFGSGSTVRDVLGNPVGNGGRVIVGDEPVIVENAASYGFEDGTVVADSLYQFGTGSWSYYRRAKTGVETALGWFDNDFTSYFGDRWSRPLRINNNSAAVAGDATNPTRAVVRYTASQTMRLDVGVCLSKTVGGDGVDYLVERNGAKLAAGVLTNTTTLSGLKVDLARNDRLDVSFGPNKVAGTDALRYRIVLRRGDRNAAQICSVNTV
jgi:hypothetical protein